MKDEDEPDFAGSEEDEQGSGGSSHDDDEKPEDLDEPMDDPPLRHRPRLLPVEPETPVVFHTNISSGGAAPVPPPPPIPIAADVTTTRNPFEEEDVAVNTRVPDTELELEADPDQPKARRTSRGRVPAPEKGQEGGHIPSGGQPSSKSMAQPARLSPVPARSGAEEGDRRGRTKGFYSQKEEAVPTSGCHWFLGRP